MLYNVSLKENAPPEELEKLKEQVKSKGGTITHEFKLIKAFTAEVPDDHVDTLQANEHVNVEQDKEVKTQ